MSKLICQQKGIHTPPVRLTLRCNKEGKLVKITACLDTGAMVHIIREAIAINNNMEIIPNDGSLKLIDAEGRPLVVTGITHVDIQHIDGI